MILNTISAHQFDDHVMVAIQCLAHDFEKRAAITNLQIDKIKDAITKQQLLKLIAFLLAQLSFDLLRRIVIKQRPQTRLFHDVQKVSLAWLFSASAIARAIAGL